MRTLMHVLTSTHLGLVWSCPNGYSQLWFCESKSEAHPCSYIPVVISKSGNVNKRVKSAKSCVFAPTEHIRMLPNPIWALLGVFFGRALFLGLPQMAGDGNGIHAGGHSFGRDLAELLPIGVVLVQSFDHLCCNIFRADASQFGDLLGFRAVGVNGPELAAGIAKQHQEVVGFRFLHFLWSQIKRKTKKHLIMVCYALFSQEKYIYTHRYKTYIKYLVFLPFIDFASQAAVSQGVLDDVLVGLGTGLLIKFRSCGNNAQAWDCRQKKILHCSAAMQM